MAFYLYQASYTADAVKALMSEPQDREAAARKLIEALGGKLHHFFFAFGTNDIVAIIEVDDDKAMAAGGLLVSASGAIANGATTKLIVAADWATSEMSFPAPEADLEPPVVQEHGEVTEQDFARSVDEIRRLSTEQGCLRVLVDTTRQTTPTSASSLYERGAHVATQLQILDLRLAILVEDRLRESHEFFENVAVNRGLKVQVFRDETAALDWLRSP